MTTTSLSFWFKPLKPFKMFKSFKPSECVDANAVQYPNSLFTTLFSGLPARKRRRFSLKTGNTAGHFWLVMPAMRGVMMTLGKFHSSESCGSGCPTDAG